MNRDDLIDLLEELKGELIVIKVKNIFFHYKVSSIDSTYVTLDCLEVEYTDSGKKVFTTIGIEHMKLEKASKLFLEAY